MGAEFQSARWYERDGLQVPGVTSIVDDAWPNVGWRIPYGAKHVAERAVFQFSELQRRLDSDDPLNWTLRWLKSKPTEVRDEAGDFGTQLHSYLEGRLKGMSAPAVLTEHERAVEQFLATYRPDPVMVEAAAMSLSYGYGGTMDGILDIYGKRYIYDLKTSPNIWTDHKVKLQLAAYRYADVVGEFVDDDKKVRHLVRDLGPVPACDGALVLAIPRDKPREWQPLLVEVGAREHSLFLGALSLWKFHKANEKDSIGEQLLAQAEEVA